jgi:N-methylhydantoinase B
LSSKTTVELEAGDVVSCRTCGGGGYGPPAEREPALVARDVREGKVSDARARDVYRVALARGVVDESETSALRRRG